MENSKSLMNNKMPLSQADEIADKIEEIVSDASVTLGGLVDEIRDNPISRASEAFHESISDGIESAWFDIKLRFGWF